MGRLFLVADLGDERERPALSQEQHVRFGGWVAVDRKVVVWEGDGKQLVLSTLPHTRGWHKPASAG